MCPRGKNSRFRHQSGIFHVKHRLVYLVVGVLGLSKTLSSRPYGNTVVTAVTLAIGEIGVKIAYRGGGGFRAKSDSRW